MHTQNLPNADFNIYRHLRQYLYGPAKYRKLLGKWGTYVHNQNPPNADFHIYRYLRQYLYAGLRSIFRKKTSKSKKI